MSSSIRIVPALPEHAEAIAALLVPYVPKGIVLPRPPEEIRRHHADFLAALDGDSVIGAVALRDYGAGLQEIRSLVVAPEHAGRGLGTRLVVAATMAAIEDGEATRVFALTLRPHLFTRIGFRVVAKELFPEKVWSDCAKCPKWDCCDEIALILRERDLDRFVADHSASGGE